jgi:two-component system, cell cycle response regulator DivK
MERPCIAFWPERSIVRERSRKRVLIVDDIPEQRDIYCTLLRFHGYDVIEAENGEEALAVAGAELPDVIVMDVMLPRLDGWQATERLKADPRTADLPVIILTSRAFKPDQERSALVGADAYLSKPCDPSNLLREVRRFVGQGPPADGGGSGADG